MVHLDTYTTFFYVGAGFVRCCAAGVLHRRAKALERNSSRLFALLLQITAPSRLSRLSPSPRPATSPIPCGNSTVYCPAGSSRPTAVSPGNYTLGGASESGRTAEEVCPKGRYCHQGVAVLCPPGTFGEQEGLDNAECSGPCPAGERKERLGRYIQRKTGSKFRGGAMLLSAGCPLLLERFWGVVPGATRTEPERKTISFPCFDVSVSRNSKRPIYRMSYMYRCEPQPRQPRRVYRLRYVRDSSSCLVIPRRCIRSGLSTQPRHLPRRWTQLFRLKKPRSVRKKMLNDRRGNE